MMRITHAIAAAILAAMPAAAMAAEAEGHITDVSFSFEGPLGVFDKAQLQRGLQVYNEVCASCHGLKYVPIRTLGDKGGPEYDIEQVKAIAALFEVPDTSDEAVPGDMRPAIPSDNFPEVTSAGAPDLSLMAKARKGFEGPMGTGISPLINGIGGPEYIYSLLVGYTGEEKEEAGAVIYENPVMPGGWIAMPPPIEDDAVEYADGTPATKEQIAKDVAAFLMWTAEPKLVERKEAGARNFLYIVLLTVLLYLTNKKLWSRIKKKKANAA
jgi:ubiquinol-cytochrome c reductase cytochrome c1 subunit